MSSRWMVSEMSTNPSGGTVVVGGVSGGGVEPGSTKFVMCEPLNPYQLCTVTPLIALLPYESMVTWVSPRIPVNAISEGVPES